MVAMLTGEDAEAERYFNKVLELTEVANFTEADKRRESAIYNLGVLKLRQEEYDQAAGYFKQALRIRKDASDTYLNLARALRGLEDIDGAIEQVEIALAFDPGFAEAHFTLAQLYEQQGDKVNASYHYAEAARISPDADLPQEALAGFGPASDWVSKASTALEEGDLERALEAALIARNLDRESIEAIKVHGSVLMARKDFRDALEVYREGLALVADDAEINRVVITIEREHPKDALAAYQAALKENPDDADLKKKIEELK
jgi:tetratricopeptide (TPR) repeat protein